MSRRGARGWRPAGPTQPARPPASEEHARLVAFLGAGISIAEDYDLTALDRSLNRTGTTLLTTEPMAPALLPTAMVTALAAWQGWVF